MDVAILGPLEVRVDGRVLPLAGPKQRALLAMFAVHANEVVSRDRLIEALWDEQPPTSVDQSLDTYISRLRRSLGRDRLLRRPGGYVLRLDAGELDLDRFESFVHRAREASAAGDPESSVALFREALALWRVPALADVIYEPFANRKAEQLEERRLTALEELVEAELALGDGARLVSELETLVRENPLRERLLGQLMLALYRAGRQVDALAVLQSARQRLARELGLEPGPQLRELERQILQQDPNLDAVRQRARSRRRPGLRAMASGVAAAALAAIATTGILLGTGGTKSARSAVQDENRLLALGLRSGELDEAIELVGLPSAMAVGAGSVWVGDSNGQVVLRVDPSSGAVVDRIPVRGTPGSLVGGGGAIWVASTLGGTIQRLDPTSSTVATLDLRGANATALAFGEGGLWIADALGRALLELDPSTGSVQRTLSLDRRPSALAIGPDSIWVADYEDGSVAEVDAVSGRTLASVNVGNGPAALGVGADAVWVANNLDSTVSRIDRRTRSVVATVAVGSGPSSLAVAGGSVWVANTYSGEVSRIDPARNVVEAIPVGGRPTEVAAAFGRVWVGSGARGDRRRGGTLRVVSTQPFPSVDPAFFESAAGFQFTRLAYDSLVTFEAQTGRAGLRLVPDLALALPTPTAGGTTYSFRLRPGIRYSDGRPVRAGDFRRGVERLFRSGSSGTDYYAGLVGARPCRKQPRRCDLARGIFTNDKAGTVSFQLREADPDFLLKLTLVGYAAPIPAGVPDRDSLLRPVPGTGPYTVAAVDREIRFARNRFFHEWSHAAQPDGNPDAIVWRMVRSPQAAVEDVERARADWFFGLIPPARLRQLQIRRPAQLRENPAFAVDFIPLNLQRPPFDDVRVRKALNYAIDRRVIARMYGGGSVATPTCQPLAPGLLGYRRYCPYTAQPRRDGAWTAPDLARARRLVAASGTHGSRIAVWAASDLPYIPRRLPAYIASVLRSLGYRTTLHVIPYATFTPTMRKRIQLSVDGDWLPDYPAPSSYLPAFFGCDGKHNRRRYVCDPGLDRRMQRASALALQDPARAAAQWTAIDHELVDRAYWVPTVNLGVADLVSSRLRNYQYHPASGFMPGQAWLR